MTRNNKSMHSMYSLEFLRGEDRNAYVPHVVFLFDRKLLSLV